MTIFERIVNNEIPSYKVYEDGLVLAFLDISQVTIGHTLVIPKVPYENIFEIPEDTLKHLIAVTKRLSVAINKAFSPEGINLLNNNGALAGQTVFHYHMHIIPRYDNTPLEALFKSKNEISVEEFKKRTQTIVQALL